MRILTERSSLEPSPYVLGRLGLAGRYLLVVGCEIDPQCRRVIRICHRCDDRPTQMFKDISRRRPERLPDHDLYAAGFPCQPFSAMGARQGVADKLGRGRIFEYMGLGR